MGIAARRRKQFLDAHPLCAFCGGTLPTATIEHCPPRAMFIGRDWPDGLRFPSCEDCNHGTAREDLLVALLARTDPVTDRGDEDGRLHLLMNGVSRAYPGLLPSMLPTARESRQFNARYGLRPPPGGSHRDTKSLTLGPEFHAAVCAVSRKLAKGIYYNEAGRIFPNDGSLVLKWFTSVEFVVSGRYDAFEQLKHLAGSAPLLRRAGRYLNNQFEYKFTMADDLFVLQVRFGFAFGGIVYGALTGERLDSSVSRLRAEVEYEGAFAILQSNAHAQFDAETSLSSLS